MTPFIALDAVALPIAVPNFDTDQIIPARFLSRDPKLGLAECLFRDLRFAADGSERADFVLNQDPFRAAQIVVGDRNFACGSSRENAVWALHHYGFRAAIAPSFGDIFANNSLKNGVLPVRLPQDVVLHHNTYDDTGEQAHRAAYDALMGAFSARNDMAADTWTRRVIGRMGKIAAMGGRDKMVAALRAMGFELH